MVTCYSGDSRDERLEPNKRTSLDHGGGGFRRSEKLERGAISNLNIECVLTNIAGDDELNVDVVVIRLP